MARLDVYQNGAARFEVGLGRTEVLRVGRGSRCDLVLPDPRVSREHFELHPAETSAAHVLVNVSAAGTLVSGEEVAASRFLKDEDVIELGSYRIFYRVRSAAAGVRPTLRRDLSPTRILTLEGGELRSERAWLETPEEKIELRARRQHLGSAPEADVRLSDEYVSRVHAVVFPADSEWQIEDQASTNGTFVGGRRVQQAALRDGDEISLGRLRLKFRAKEVKEKVPPASVGVFGALLGESAAMRALFGKAERVAASDAPVLLLGESGTGKELLAAALHDASARAGRAFVPVNCGALPENLAESELFGHERGAFTGAEKARPGLFAEADGGTLFLDEVAELSEALQVKLLRSLESGEIRPVGSNRSSKVDARVLAATHRDLASRVREGKFREDLYYRLAVVTLRLPPLRERESDLELIAKSLLPEGRKFSKRALEKLRAHEWRGNVRELRNAVERAAIFSDETDIGPDAVLFDDLSALPPEGLLVVHPELARMSLDDVERELITAALKRTNGVQNEAARQLGIAKSTLYGKMERYGLRETNFKKD